MKRLNRKTFIFSICVLSLAGFVAFKQAQQAARSKPRYVLEKTEMFPKHSYIGNDTFDTQINIVVKDRWPFFARPRSETTSWGLDMEWLSYFDENGKESGTNEVYERMYPQRNGRWLITYQVSLKKAPKTARKVILSSVITINNTERIPIKIRLR
jgi:hypothetical protein